MLLEPLDRAFIALPTFGMNAGLNPWGLFWGDTPGECCTCAGICTHVDRQCDNRPGGIDCQPL